MEIASKNRLQFVHCDTLFSTRDEAIAYVTDIDTGDKYGRPALYAEPMILKYGTETDPNIILAIGSIGDGENKSTANRTYFIDFAKHEEEIQTILEKVDEIDVVKEILGKVVESCGLNEDGTNVVYGNDIIFSSHTINEAIETLANFVQANVIEVKETPSIKLTKEGNELSADVKLAETWIDNNRQVLDNIIIETPNGLFANVDLGYEEDTLNLLINGDVAKSFDLPKELHVVKGEYEPEDETIKLTMNDDSIVSIEVGLLIAEWDVTVENKTPIVLTKTKVKSEKDEHGVTTNQDTLSADVTLHVGDNNILVKSDNGTSLYVNGSASNIKTTNGTVQEDLDVILGGVETDGSIKNAVNSEKERALEAEREISEIVNDFSGKTYTEFYTLTESLKDFSAQTEEYHTSHVEFSAETLNNAIIANSDKINFISGKTLELQVNLHKEQDRAEQAEQKINVTYDSAKNQLTFVNSEGISSDLQLNAGSIVDDIHYEPVTEEIVITYTDTNKVQHTVKVPVTALINEWDVDNTNTTVTLTKTTPHDVSGKDKLSANVNISTDEDNILVSDGKCLKVSNSSIKEVETALQAEITRATEAEAELNTAINAEKERAENAETALQAEIEGITVSGTSNGNVDVTTTVVGSVTSVTANLDLSSIISTDADNILTLDGERLKVQKQHADSVTASYKDNPTTVQLVINDLNARITTLEGQIDAQNAIIERLNEIVETLNDKVTELNDDVKALNKKCKLEELLDADCSDVSVFKIENTDNGMKIGFKDPHTLGEY